MPATSKHCAGSDTDWLKDISLSMRSYIAAGLWQASISSQRRAGRIAMSSHLHHVVMCSHSANDFVAFLTDVVGMTIQQQFHVPGELCESTLGWPPSSGTQVTMLGSGDSGLIEVLDVPAALHEVVPEGLAALSFLPTDAGRVRQRAQASAHDTRSIDIGVPGYELFFCTVGGVPIEIIGGYSDTIDLGQSDATNS